MADQPMPRSIYAPTRPSRTPSGSMADEIAWPRRPPRPTERRTSPRSSRRGSTGRAGPPPGTPAVRRPRWTWRPARPARSSWRIDRAARTSPRSSAQRRIGLPGLRIIFGGPEPSPTAPAVPSVQRLGAVGASASPSVTAASSADAGRRRRAPRSARHRARARDGGRPRRSTRLAGFHVRWPPDGTFGPPDATWIDPSPQRPGRARLGLVRHGCRKRRRPASA